MITLLLVSPLNLVSGWFFSNKVCYEHIGCFSNEYPYNAYIMLLPESPEHMQIQFYLFTRQSSDTPHLLDPYDSKTIRRSSFDGSKETILIIHGYRGSGTTAWQRIMKDELFKKDDVNVIVVDWEKGADNTLNYAQSAANTRVVGATIEQLIRALVSSGSSSYDKFTLVGHSLGAHVAGYAGSYLGGSIARIYGLDPAGPNFENTDYRARLDRTDAQYVEAIHTDQESLVRAGFGIKQAVGHADFYPNGGQDQPGCIDILKKRYEIFDVITDGIACSHMRVLNLFTESINSDCFFIGAPCPSREDYISELCGDCGSGCAEMGYNSRSRGQGTYYFGTHDKSPFCKVNNFS